MRRVKPDRMARYESEKRELEKKNLGPKEYEKALRELARRFGV